jgi:nucleoside-diphosphate-sugar epimerase
MKAFITGGTGFVGSHLADLLLEKGFEIVTLKRPTSNTRWLEGKNVKFIEGDLFSKKAISEGVKDADYIFHIAGVVKSKNEEGFEKSNFIATKNLLETVYETSVNIKKFIHISTQALCGPSPGKEPIDENYVPKPITAYGRTKLKAENEVLKYKDKFPVTIIRPPAVFGERDTEIFVYFKSYKMGINSIIGFDDKLLSLVYVKDLVKGIYLAAMSEKANGNIFFICNDKQYSWNEISETTGRLMNKKALKIRIPHFIVYTAGAAAQFFSMFSKNAATLNLEKCRDLTQKYWTCSNRKAKEVLGFKADYTLEEAFRNTINWYKENKWL